MKKVLALVLTAAMLLSCMIVGISAVREITLETIEGASITASSEEASFAGELDFVKDFASRNITSYIAEFKIMASQTDFGGAPAE
ncbi:MAG: hypothetical protein IKD18_01760, partial [Clostridia bacterium]|nr:hypothetical protein [Clostridia bacterium]